MGGDHIRKSAPCKEPVPHSLLLLLIVLYLAQFLPGRPVEKDIVLVGTQTPLLHQLRREDLLIDGSAQVDIALPLSRRAVVGRRGCQGDDRHPLQLLHKLFQRLPPLAP